jgi:hypothetical protein
VVRLMPGRTRIVVVGCTLMDRPSFRVAARQQHAGKAQGQPSTHNSSVLYWHLLNHCHPHHHHHPIMQGYQGHRLSAGQHAEVDVVRIDQLDAQTCWANYVSQRKPVRGQAGSRARRGGRLHALPTCPAGMHAHPALLLSPPPDSW